MDTAMNYNSTPHSQILPPLVDRFFPDIFHQIKADEFRGNFLSAVGRLVDDATLLDDFWYHYNQVKSGKNPASSQTQGQSVRARESRNNGKKIGEETLTAVSTFPRPTDCPWVSE